MKRAILIGINYRGQRSELAGCANDILDMYTFLVSRGYTEFRILTDEPSVFAGVVPLARTWTPSKLGIEAAFAQVMDGAASGDEIFVHYSGHGGQLRALDGFRTESDGQDETLIPLDYEAAGEIRDQDLRRMLVEPARLRGVRLRVILDCCHSGTGLDLEWNARPAGGRGIPAGARTAEGGSPAEAPTPATGAGLDTPFSAQVRAHAADFVDSVVESAIQSRLADWFGAETAQKIPLGGIVPPRRVPEPGTGPGSEPSASAGASADASLATWGEASAEGFPRGASADVLCFSGCQDSQTSADAEFSRRPNGALTYCFLAAVKRTRGAIALLQTIGADLRRRGFEQVPQLSSCGRLSYDRTFI